MRYPRWMWKNPKECKKCGRDLITQDEIERQICDDCNQKDVDPYENYLKFGVSPGEKDEIDE